MNELRKNEETISYEKNKTSCDYSFAWAAVEIINGPNGKDVLKSIKSISTYIGLLIAFGLILGYAPSIRFGNMQLALLKA